jgi:hypothetical protein
VEGIISIEHFNTLYQVGIILDGRKGGIIIGNSHRKGGIQLICSTGPETIVHAAEIEGFEFLLSAEATERYHDEIQEINSHMRVIMKKRASIPRLWDRLCKRFDDDLYAINTIIDFEFPLPSKWIFVSGKQFVVNKYSTLTHYERLRACLGIMFCPLDEFVAA